MRQPSDHRPKIVGFLWSVELGFMQGANGWWPTLRVSTSQWRLLLKKKKERKKERKEEEEDDREEGWAFGLGIARFSSIVDHLSTSFITEGDNRSQSYSGGQRRPRTRCGYNRKPTEFKTLGSVYRPTWSVLTCHHPNGRFQAFELGPVCFAISQMEEGLQDSTMDNELHDEPRYCTRVVINYVFALRSMAFYLREPDFLSPNKDDDEESERVCVEIKRTRNEQWFI
ncbi:hypothetical protein TIFTF001_020549 [Ficus carica]|uniref:Uncharacterized protein n=1 Tax=Ficus carica TaxID=3494 RepID=A0AA88D9W9_FICCA|nr:hypothetical protein TIFTF001_020549 [Ficus carica]